MEEPNSWTAKKRVRSKKFTGIVTTRERELAEYLSQFNLYGQKHFDKAKEIKRRMEKSINIYEWLIKEVSELNLKSEKIKENL